MWEHDVSESEACGLSWRKTGDVEKPKEGTELKHAALAEALAIKTEFTQQEWVSFAVSDLRGEERVLPSRATAL